ncbi:MAG: hypothetical protein EXS36_06530 [Pedosphaera sp.]|nr:hypothetical protein [Pedosphaera sp.]
MPRKITRSFIHQKRKEKKPLKYILGITAIIALTATVQAQSVLTIQPSVATEIPIGVVVSRVNVNQRVMLGRNYVLESSADLTNWAATGPAFTARSENSTTEFVVGQIRRFFRLRQIDRTVTEVFINLASTLPLSHTTVSDLLGVISGPTQPTDSSAPTLTMQLQDIGVTSIRNNDYYDDRLDIEQIFNCGGSTYPSWEGYDANDEKNYNWT